MQYKEKAPLGVAATEGRQRMDAKSNHSIDCPSLDVKPLGAFKEAIRNAGLPCPDQILPDGKLHRFSTNGKNGDKAGFYALFDNGGGHFGGYFGCWRSQVEETWKSVDDNQLTDQEREQINQRIERKRKQAQEENAKEQDQAAHRAQEEYESLKSITDHPYLSQKKVRAYGILDLKVDSRGNLVIPVHNADCEICSLQKITPNGDKYFLKHGATKGMFHVIDGNRDQVVIAEGYATAASIHEATGATVVVAFNAGNLKTVAEQIQKVYPDKVLTIAADNDRWTSLSDGRVNPGLIKANEAAVAVGGQVVCPEFKTEHLKDRPKDFNDLAILYGLEAVKKSFSEQGKSAKIWDQPVDLTSLIDIEPAPIAWFVQDRIISGRGLVITGVGGSSKTRMIYHLAAGAALGRLPWEWTVNQKGRSILVLTEDVADDLHRTMHNLCLSLELSYEEKFKVYHSIIPYPLAGEDVKLLAKAQAGTLEKSPLFQALSQKIKDFGDIAFIGLDPALSLTDGDELDQGNQRALGKMADDLAVQTGAACALVTHATKGSLAKDELTSHNSRGGGAITDAVRAEFVMRTMTSKEAIKAKLQDPEERFRHVQLVGTKGNYLPPDAYIPVWLRRDQYGVLHEAELSFDEEQATSKDMEALDILKDIAKTTSPPIRDWRRACVNAGVITAKSENAQVKDIDRIKNKLKKLGYIKQGHGRGIWLPVKEDDFLDFNN
jgi:putative DNA primase/helicase